MCVNRDGYGIFNRILPDMKEDSKEAKIAFFFFFFYCSATSKGIMGSREMCIERELQNNGVISRTKDKK